MKIKLHFLLLPIIGILSCFSGRIAPFDIKGRVTFDFLPVSASGINYANKSVRPARRIIVKAISNGVVVAKAITNDNGEYLLHLVDTKDVAILATSAMVASNYSPDGIGLDSCNGASWDVHIKDGSNQKQFALMNNQTYNENSIVNLYAETTHNGNNYTTRAGAPFAILDTILEQLELVCKANGNQNFSSLNVYWSSTYDSSNIPGATTNYDMNTSSLYILGKENVDTDEYDAHVIAHEFAHYLEDKIFRTDSIGGAHIANVDILDNRVAFSEGFANAMSAMSLKTSLYLDTNGFKQASIGLSLNIASTSSSNFGIYSELSAGYFIYKLFTARNNFDRIHNILSVCQKNTNYVTSLLTFAYCYATTYGSTADNLNLLWTNDLKNNSLVSILDVFDSSNTIGNEYKAGAVNARTYDTTRNNIFWQIYRTYSPYSTLAISGGFLNGVAASAGTHASYPYNKYGAVKLYRFTGNGATLNFTVTLASCTSATKVFQIKVLSKGKVISSSSNAGSTSPSLSFSSTVGNIYLLEIDGWTNSCTSWTITST